MTPTEQLEAYLSTNRDSRQDWLQRISRNTVGPPGASSPRGHTGKPLNSGGHLNENKTGASSDCDRSGEARRAVSKPSKATLLQKLKLAQQQQRPSTVQDPAGPYSQMLRLQSAAPHSRRLKTKSLQRSVSFELPPSNIPQDSKASSQQLKGISLPSPPARRCSSALTGSTSTLLRTHQSQRHAADMSMPSASHALNLGSHSWAAPKVPADARCPGLGMEHDNILFRRSSANACSSSGRVQLMQTPPAQVGPRASPEVHLGSSRASRELHRLWQAAKAIPHASTITPSHVTRGHAQELQEADCGHQPSAASQPSARQAAAKRWRSADGQLSEVQLLSPPPEASGQHMLGSRQRSPQQHAWESGQSPGRPVAPSACRSVRRTQPYPLSCSSRQRHLPSRHLSFVDAVHCSPTARDAAGRFPRSKGSMSVQPEYQPERHAPRPHDHQAGNTGADSAAWVRSEASDRSLDGGTAAMASTPEGMYQAALKRIGALLKPDPDLYGTPARTHLAHHRPHASVDCSRAAITVLDSATRSAPTQAYSATGSNGTEEYAARAGPSYPSHTAVAHSPAEAVESMYDAGQPNASALGSPPQRMQRPGAVAPDASAWSPTGRLKLRLACKVGQIHTQGSNASNIGPAQLLRPTGEASPGKHDDPGSKAQPLQRRDVLQTVASKMSKPGLITSQYVLPVNEIARSQLPSRYTPAGPDRAAHDDHHSLRWSSHLMSSPHQHAPGRGLQSLYQDQAGGRSAAFCLDTEGSLSPSIRQHHWYHSQAGERRGEPVIYGNDEHLHQQMDTALAASAPSASELDGAAASHSLQPESSAAAECSSDEQIAQPTTYSSSLGAQALGDVPPERASYVSQESGYHACQVWQQP
ncbi:hypothetical protein WJX74_007570 [Apatococcus lobatus]|uniref:Uncharacterized protein n=1 Tax=Apatococcus lobatus TaxID=904363 RepID=A0AAW1S5I2_9CHLO